MRALKLSPPHHGCDADGHSGPGAGVFDFGRSPLEWIIDRYHVKTDKASGIVNDPNDFLREQGRPDAVVDLIKRLVTVSMRTQELLSTLPPLEIPEGK